MEDFRKLSEMKYMGAASLRLIQFLPTKGLAASSSFLFLSLLFLLLSLSSQLPLRKKKKHYEEDYHNASFT